MSVDTLTKETINFRVIMDQMPAILSIELEVKKKQDKSFLSGLKFDRNFLVDNDEISISTGLCMFGKNLHTFKINPSESKILARLLTEKNFYFDFDDKVENEGKLIISFIKN